MSVSEDLVERVALAIYRQNFCLSADDAVTAWREEEGRQYDARDSYRDLARAAIAVTDERQ